MILQPRRLRYAVSWHSNCNSELYRNLKYLKCPEYLSPQDKRVTSYQTSRLQNLTHCFLQVKKLPFHPPCSKQSDLLPSVQLWKTIALPSKMLNICPQASLSKAFHLLLFHLFAKLWAPGMRTLRSPFFRLDLNAKGVLTFTAAVPPLSLSVKGKRGGWRRRLFTTALWS